MKKFSREKKKVEKFGNKNNDRLIIKCQSTIPVAQ